MQFTIDIPETHYYLYKDYALDQFKHSGTYPLYFEVESDNNGPVDYYGDLACTMMLKRVLKEIGE